MLLGRGQQRSKLSSSAAAGSGRCLEPGVGALAPVPSWAHTEEGGRREAPGGLLHMRCVGGAMSSGLRLGYEGSPPPPAGAQGSPVDGDAGSCPAHPTSTPALVLAAPPRPVHAHTCTHTRICAHTGSHTHCAHAHSRAHTLEHVQCPLTRTHTAHPQQCMALSYAHTHMCTHSCHMCTNITYMHSLTCTRRHVQRHLAPPSSSTGPAHTQ